MTVPELIALIASTVGILGTITAIFFSLKNGKKADVTEIEKRVEENTRINLKLDEIITIIRDMKAETAELKGEVRVHADRIIKVEESTKQAHHRLDTLEAKVDRRGDN